LHPCWPCPAIVNSHRPWSGAAWPTALTDPHSRSAVRPIAPPPRAPARRTLRPPPFACPQQINGLLGPGAACPGGAVPIRSAAHWRRSRPLITQTSAPQAIPPDFAAAFFRALVGSAGYGPPGLSSIAAATGRPIRPTRHGPAPCVTAGSPAADWPRIPVAAGGHPHGGEVADGV